MKEFQHLLANLPLFAGFTREELSSVLDCLAPRVVKFAREEALLFYGDKVDFVSVLLAGEAQIERDDLLGNRSIVAHLSAGDIFGEAFASASVEGCPVAVISKSQCTVLQLDFKRIITACVGACVFHTRLIENMMRILAMKNLQLNDKIACMSCRTIREKLLAYLGLRVQEPGERFNIPFNKTQLADYLCVDRSAMVRELTKLCNEGIIGNDKNTYWLIDE